MPPPDPLTDLVAALPRLRRYARVLTSDPLRADDLVLETLDSARGSQHALPPAPSLRTRLFTLMHSLHRNRESRPWDAQVLRSRRPFNDPPKAANDPQGAVHSPRPDADDLLTRIMRMPLDEREVLVLVAVEGLGYAEIAALLGVPIATVMATLIRARRGMCEAPAPSSEEQPQR
jgi:RNA polymerase sigma-70 factor (ECF subfamily)